MTELYTLDDLGSLQGAAVFVRVDFNVPLEDGRVADASRIRAALPTLDELSSAGAKLVLASHCGRPKGRPDPRYSLRPVAGALADVWGRPVAFAEDAIGAPARAQVDELEPGGACLLENLRFHAGETANDPAFAAELAALADAYVDDAFGSAHRAHASVVGITVRMGRRAAGRLLVREVAALGRLLGEPERPFVAVVGGAKIEGKVDALVNLLPRLDALLLGGGMANTFLAAQGQDLAGSLVEADRLDVARDILGEARRRGVEVVLPADLVVTDDLASPQRIETVPAAEVPGGTLAVDIGPEARRLYGDRLAGARTVFWNGPMGVFETPPFDAGTLALARALAACRGFTVIGGGETVAAASRAGVTERIGHVSTGGGASLEFLAGRTLPGVAALERKR